MKHLRLFEEFDRDGYKSHWSKFEAWIGFSVFWLSEKGVDVDMEKLKSKFFEIANNDDYSSEQKADEICNYLNDFGYSDNYFTETGEGAWDYLDKLFMDEI